MDGLGRNGTKLFTCKRFFLLANARFDPIHIGKRAIISKAEYAIDWYFNGIGVWKT